MKTYIQFDENGKQKAVVRSVSPPVIDGTDKAHQVEVESTPTKQYRYDAGKLIPQKESVLGDDMVKIDDSSKAQITVDSKKLTIRK